MLIMTGSTGTVTFGPGSRAGQTHVIAGQRQTFGPFNRAAQVLYLTAGTSALVYEAPMAVAAPLVVVSSAAPTDNDGRPDGTIYIQTS